MPSVPTKASKLTEVELVAMLKACYTPAQPAEKASLADRFLLPPFSVLDARQGYWQNRKRMWLALGIQSELGRGDAAARAYGDHEWPATHGMSIPQMGKNNGLLGFSEQARSHYKQPNDTPGGSPLEAATLKNGKTQRGDGRGRPLATTFGSGKPGDLAAGFKGTNKLAPGGTGKNTAWIHKTTEGFKSGKELIDEAQRLDASPYNCYEDSDDTSRRIASAQPQSGTSIFDPVLCELAYRWFCPQQGHILDPFAGGSVRGIVASKLGRKYTGVDLRPEQAEANVVQASTITPDNSPTWVVGDSQNIDELAPGEYDLVFSCPPYFDLEAYSTDPRDLSSMTYEQFLEVYGTIIAKSCAMLKEDRFACFVVGDIRDRQTGNYRGFVWHTVEAFRAAGLELYNEAVLVTSVGSLPIRVGKQFAGYRKLGKTHQNVLVFVKGDAGRASAACGMVDMSDLSMPELPSIETVALSIDDVAGSNDVGELIEHVYGTDADLMVVGDNATEGAVVADILRSRARASNSPNMRVWVSKRSGWEKVPDDVDLCYIVGDKPYLNKDVFESHVLPPAVAPTVKRLVVGTGRKAIK